MKENHRYESGPSINKLSQTSLLSRHHTLIALFLGGQWYPSRKERVSNAAIVFRTIAVVDFFGGPAVLEYYRIQWQPVNSISISGMLTH